MKSLLRIIFIHQCWNISIRDTAQQVIVRAMPSQLRREVRVALATWGYQSKPFWLGPLCYKLQSTDLTVLINKYLFYFLQSRSEMLLGLKKEGRVPAVNKSDLVRLGIPVPSLEEQKRIVAILDKFDALTNSHHRRLAAEIELRQKQYEYYRDLLL